MVEISTSISSWLFLVFFFFGFHSCFAIDTLVPGQSLTGKQTLISAGEKFVLGFFTPGNSQNRYLGIWFNKVQTQTVVWVANRENPITDSSIGILQFSNNGNLVLLSNTTNLWSTNVWVSAGSSAKLLDSGNLVLLDDNSGTFLWQSFDYPTDTYIAGMKLGRNLKSGLNWSLTSWASSDDPAPGNFTLMMDIRGLPHFVTLLGRSIYRIGGAWNGQGWSGFQDMGLSYISPVRLFNSQDEIYIPDPIDSNSTLTYRLVLDKSGSLELSNWEEQKQVWRVFWAGPRDPCQFYGACGPFAVCNSANLKRCECLQGFVPRSEQEWSVDDWSGGCVIRKEIKCGEKDGFFKLGSMKLPEVSLAQVDQSLSLDECRSRCLGDCSCRAYANSDVRGGGSGCIVWVSDLNDLQEIKDGGQDFYLRLDASELGSSTKKRRTLAIAVATPLAAMLVLVVWCSCLVCKKNMKGEEAGKDGSEKASEFSLFDFGMVEAATNNFSIANKLGEGGFGMVYKGMMPNGQEIAVKRLSKSSGQGTFEFENESDLTSKLQHRNLVRLLGYCTHGEEKILMYEYMPNRGLDSFLFDPNKSALLGWTKRFNIIIGIARGILYLHEDSRLRIIHRDLKSSNILLDSEMSPKISDFGMARSFGRHQIQENTKNVVGTYGYMSPEYAMRGFFSEKSDVFSFGVLVLEIVSGKKSNGFYDESLSLIGYGWQLWKEGRAKEFMDPCLGDSYPMREVLRCIHIGLLCVQDSPGDRPNMSSVLFMLNSETELATPEKPAFSVLLLADVAPIQQKAGSINNVTITMMEAR